jgi:AI-2 transport protein TqsA
MELRPPPKSATGERVLLVAASAVILIAGLKAASAILVPIVLSALVAALCLPPMRWMQRRGVPDWATLPAMFALMIGVAVGFTALVGAEVADFKANIGRYEETFQGEWSSQIDSVTALIGKWTDDDMTGPFEALRSWLGSGKVIEVMGVVMGALTDVLSNTLFVLLTVIFIVGEAAGFPRKLGEAFSESVTGVDESKRAVRSIHDYVRVKTEISLATGLLAFFLCLAVGVESPVLWGVVAFALNYIPTIGSLVAAVPPLLLALALQGGTEALIIAAGYFLINTVLGNVLEPKLLGRKLGLSALVVFLSLVFWGYVWGPVGMLLSVPLTMLAKILMEQSDDLRWLAILMGPGGEDLRPGKVPDLVLATQTIDIGKIERPDPTPPGDDDG